jgi:hypothetical protein
MARLVAETGGLMYRLRGAFRGDSLVISCGGYGTARRHGCMDHDQFFIYI